jgi:hypothetical protein
MKLPPRVKLGPHRWRFGWHEGPQDSGDGEPQKCWGQNHLDSLKITFDKTLRRQPPTFQAEVVVHEVQHAVNSVFGVVDELCEEEITDRSARGWLQLIAENPEFIEYVRNLAITPDETDEEPSDRGPDPVPPAV